MRNGVEKHFGTRNRCFRRTDAGYTLIGLLAMMAVSSILLATIAPTWGHLVTRDKEEELIFRGNSYKLAIERYQKEFNKLPSKLEDLEKGKFIRKLYDDPMTGYEFELILQAPDGRKRESELTASQQKGVRGTAPGSGSFGIVGVVSTSEEVAIRPYQDKERYNEWEFIAGEGGDDQNQQSQPGQGDDDDDDDRGSSRGGVRG